MDTFGNSVFPHLFTVSMALPSRLIQHNSNDTTTPSPSSRSIRHYINNSTTPSRFNIGTFNVRGLSSATKRNQLSEYLGRLHIDILLFTRNEMPRRFRRASRQLPAHRVTVTVPALRSRIRRRFAYGRSYCALLV